MAGEYVEFHNNSQPALNETNVNLMQQLIRQDIQGTVSGDTLPVGAIMPYGSDTIPENWLLCNGQAVSRTDYQQLFNTIGTTFGTGDGFTTFNLPNLKGKIAVGKDVNDTDFDILGETGGEIEYTTTVSNIGYIVTNYIIKASQSAGVVATVVDNLNSTSTTNALSAKQGKTLADRMSYSTTEQIIGKWIDGNTIYRKVIDISNLPNATIKQVAYNISNLDKVINLFGIAYELNTPRHYPLPYVSTAALANNIGINIEGSYININTGTDRSGLTGYVIIEYTKSTS